MPRGKTGVINLSSGMPDLPMPPFIVERLRASLDSAYMPYTNYYGFPELREKTRCTWRPASGSGRTPKRKSWSQRASKRDCIWPCGRS